MIQLADLLEAMAPAGARLVGPPTARRFEGFAYDSRNLRPGELFLAVRTVRADGHDFIAEAVRRGATGIVGDRLVESTIPRNVTAIAVDDTLAALQSWARFSLDRYAPIVIAAVGNVGKTTAAKSIVAVLGSGLADDPEIFDSDNHNTLYGLSIALGQLRPSHRVAVLEFVGEEPGDLLAFARLTRPTIAVVVGSLDSPAANEELERFLDTIPATGQIAFNADAVPSIQIEERRSRSGPTVWAYRIGRPADLWADDVRLTLDQTRFVLGDNSGGRAEVCSRVLGRAAISGALAAATVGRARGRSLEEIAECLSRLDPLPGRIRLLPGIGESLILDDSFDAGPRSLSAGLELLALAPGRKTVVLGDLADPQPDRSGEIHRGAGPEIAKYVDRLVTLGRHAEHAARAAKSSAGSIEIFATDSAADARDAARVGLGAGDVTLVVGGSGARLERVVEGLLAEPARAPELLVRQAAGWKQRVFFSTERPTWVEVDLAAIGRNVVRLRELAHPAQLMAVLKADGYGHGAVRVARTAILHGAHYLATACLSEAIALREAGISAPILILGHTPPWQVHDIVAYDLTATVFSLEPVRQLARAALAGGGGRARVQIKVDTGMGRLGLLPPDVPAFVEAVRAMPDIDAEGIFTHFASADSPDPEATKKQIARFDEVLEVVGRIGWTPRYVHASDRKSVV